MKIKASERSVQLPEKVEPNSCTLLAFKSGRNSPCYRVIHVHWHEFEALLARNGNRELRGSVSTFAVHPNQKELHVYPLPTTDTEAVFRYSPTQREI